MKRANKKDQEELISEVIEVEGGRRKHNILNERQPGSDQPTYCCHIHFERLSDQVLTTYSNGFAEVLSFPKLHRTLVLQQPITTGEEFRVFEFMSWFVIHT